MAHMRSTYSGDIMIPNAPPCIYIYIYIYRKSISSFWGKVFYIRNRILLGSTTKKTPLNCGNWLCGAPYSKGSLDVYKSVEGRVA